MKGISHKHWCFHFPVKIKKPVTQPPLLREMISVPTPFPQLEVDNCINGLDADSLTTYTA